MILNCANVRPIGDKSAPPPSCIEGEGAQGVDRRIEKKKHFLTEKLLLTNNLYNLKTPKTDLEFHNPVSIPSLFLMQRYVEYPELAS